MSWLVSTSTARITGNSSMATATALSRTVTAIPASKRITSFHWEWQLNWGVGAGTYGTFPVGKFAQASNWLCGISYVVSPGAAPNLLTTPDDTQFLDVQSTTDGYDRNTINNTGAPTLQDEFRWTGSGEGRLQLPAGTGGSIFFHVANITANTIVTEWWVMVRATYA